MSRTAAYEGRDIRPTTDYESLFKAALIDHLGVSPVIVEDEIFPDSRDHAGWIGSLAVLLRRLYIFEWRFEP